MAPPSEKAKMLTGDLYNAKDPELAAERRRAQRLLAQYNATGADDRAARTARNCCAGCLARSATAPTSSALRLRLRLCDPVGKNAFINHNCVFLDCAPIEIGDDLGNPARVIRRLA